MFLARPWTNVHDKLKGKTGYNWDIHYNPKFSFEKRRKEQSENLELSCSGIMNCSCNHHFFVFPSLLPMNFLIPTLLNFANSLKQLYNFCGVFFFLC